MVKIKRAIDVALKVIEHTHRDIYIKDLRRLMTGVLSFES